MQARDLRVFNNPELVRSATYRGTDMSYTTRSEIGAAEPVDHGARPLLVKFSRLHLSRYTPEQRKILLEQMKFEQSLPARELNAYLSARYSDDDMEEIWRMQRTASSFRGNKAPVKKPKNEQQKRAISRKAKQPIPPHVMAERIAKAKATRERNKNNPNYASCDTIKREHLRQQRLLAKRHEVRMKEAISVYADGIVARKVSQKTAKLDKEVAHLKEYIKQNGLPLPGTKAAKMRRESLRK